MTLIHLGIRPEFKLVYRTQKLRAIDGFRYELLPDGSYKVWSMRALKSGCNQVVSGNKRIGDLIYCDYCDEFFSLNQFQESDDD